MTFSLGNYKSRLGWVSTLPSGRRIICQCQARCANQAVHGHYQGALAWSKGFGQEHQPRWDKVKLLARELGGSF